MTLEEKVRKAAQELRRTGHHEDAEVVERNIEYISRVWKDSPPTATLGDDLADVQDCIQRILTALGNHVAA
ncbi:hypothetical protein SAMN05421810_10151 [Amycolatopsis arida]|uniref:Uncharacterized protein n=1 Tax=Amycolatopsis arida TaxID=587909 RepID=A0A1I5KAL9_9PSEU|nr:hypothetical protein [Amycolatopsis arida]TDX96947.1 hypothetical protein CLV69_10249 [Amycolatopsis arida]SFO81646.1 hypothetical protein SAMN05421810_10151 [Amycolatopsis arida]